MKRIIALITLCVLASALLAGCGDKTGEAPAAESTAEPAPVADAEPVSTAEPAITAEPEPAEAALSFTVTPEPEETVLPTVAPGETKLTFTAEEAEEGTFLTRWRFGETEAAEFYTVVPSLPEGFTFAPGNMYAGADAALLCGVVQGDGESGTAEYLLTEAGEEPETVLTLMYARDKVALLELDADLRAYMERDEVTGLWLAVFTEDSALRFSDAEALLKAITEGRGMALVYSGYGM